MTPPSRGVSAFGIVPSAGVSLSTTGPPGAGTAVTHCHDTIFFSTDLSSPDVVKVLDGHGDLVLGGEEETVSDLASVLRVGRFGVRVLCVELHPVLHFRSVEARNNFVHYVLQSFVSPEIGKVIKKSGDMAKRLIRKLLGCDDKLGIVYLRDSKGFVL